MCVNPGNLLQLRHIHQGRVAKFLLVQHTKTGKMYQMTTK
jgi:hypothetical protein